MLVRESSQFLEVKIYKFEALRTKNPMLLGFNPQHIYIVQVLKIFPIVTMCIKNPHLYRDISHSDNVYHKTLLL